MRDRDWALREGADAFLPRPAELARVLQLASRLANARGPARRASRGTGWARLLLQGCGGDSSPRTERSLPRWSHSVEGSA